MENNTNLDTFNRTQVGMMDEKPKDKDYYIYKTTNILNNKFYIGKRHYKKKDDKWYLGSGVLLKKAIEKYGRENFKKEIIEWCFSPEEVNVREKFWITKLDALNPKIAYNLAPGGDGGFWGEEACKKISMKLKGMKRPPEFGNKVSKALKGKKKSQEHIEKVRNALIGRKRTEEEIENMSKAILKLYEEGFESPIQIPIYQYDIKTGNFINSYKSCEEASRVTGFSREAINKACLGDARTSNNYIWSRAKFKNYYNRFSAIKAEIICHSKRINTGEEIITYKLTYPRCIHSEIMTYHMMSVNSASSRAIPTNKLIEVIEDTPFYPCYFQLQHKGMQGNSYADYSTEQKAFKYWNKALHANVRIANDLSKDVTKQLVNRLLEPYQYHCCLMTGTRESFEHLFEQRCPQYEFELDEGDFMTYKSKKEFMDIYGCYKDKDDLWWLQHNKGQAEIHFMDLAEKMYDALHESKPQILKEDQWHIPFDSEITQQLGTLDIPFEDMIKMSVAKTARISYTTIEGTKDLTLEQASEMFDKLKNSGHWSCFGHIGRCMNEEEYESWVRGKLKGYFVSPLERQTIQDNDGKSFLHGRNMDLVKPHFDPKDKGWCRNLKGFIPLRQMVEQNS